MTLLLAACASSGLGPEKAGTARSTVEHAAELSPSAVQYLARRQLKPQPTRALNVRSRCTHRDAAGTATELDLLIADAEVKVLDAEIHMKGQGSCRFALGEFSQEATLPQALLRHKSNEACTIRFWEQGPKVTMAFNSCPESCDGQAFDYLWPVIVDAKTGDCH